MMVRLLYACRAGEKLTQEMIDGILALGRKDTAHQGITGLLCYSGDLLMQVLEGGREAVNQLYQAISADPRHRDVVLMHYEEISERRFAAWTMGQVNLCRVNPSIVLKYSERPTFDPYALSGAMAMALLEELVATASIVSRPA